MANFESYNKLLDATLGELEERGNKEAKKQRNKKGGKNKPKEKSKAHPGSPEATRETVKIDAVNTPPLDDLDLPELELEEDYEIKEEETQKEITNKVDFQETHKKIGEEVSEEYVNELVSESKDLGEGFKATVIIHTRTVTEEGSPINEDFEITEGSNQAPEAPPEAPQASSDAKNLLIRKDTGETYDIVGKLKIGREAGNDIVIPEPDGHYVSERHATIEIDYKGRIVLRDGDIDTGYDKKSTNGTFVNGTKIGRKYVKPGDEIRFANIDFVISENS